MASRMPTCRLARKVCLPLGLFTYLTAAARPCRSPVYVPAELAVDTGTANASVLPTITVEDVDRSRAVNGNGVVANGNGVAGQKANGVASPTSPAWPASPTEPADPEAPGAMPNGPAPEIPDWYKLGWRDVSGIDKAPAAAGDEADKEVLTLFLKEQFYGEWYHNAALIVAVSGFPG